jgi:hypothetical protein
MQQKGRHQAGLSVSHGLERRVSQSTRRDHITVVDVDTISATQIVTACLFIRTCPSAIHPDHDPVVAVGMTTILFGIVADDTTGDGSCNRRGLATIALADLVAEGTTNDCTEHGAATDMVSALTDRFDANDAAAGIATPTIMVSVITSVTGLGGLCEGKACNQNGCQTCQQDSIEHDLHSSIRKIRPKGSGGWRQGWRFRDEREPN